MSVPTPGQLKELERLGADSSLPRDRNEVGYIINLASREIGRESKRKGTERLGRLIEERRLIVGSLVVFDSAVRHPKVYTIKRITADNYILLKEEKGKFHPTTLILA